MGLFDKRKTVEDVLTDQVADLTARLQASQAAREAELMRHEKKEAEFFATQQDLIHTIMLLKNIPIMELDDNGNSVEVKPVPSIQRRTWAQIITGKELEARNAAAERRRQIDEANKRKARGVQ